MSASQKSSARHHVYRLVFARKGSVRGFLWQSRSIRWGYYRTLFPFRYWLWSSSKQNWLKGRDTTVAFVPQEPSTGHVVSKTCAVSGYRIVSELDSNPQLIISWVDDTYPSLDPRLADAIRTKKVLNGRINNITKIY